MHEVLPVTRGHRIACFMWMQSMVREIERRRLLDEMDMAILALREEQGDTPAAVGLTGCYRNLMGMRAEA